MRNAELPPDSGSDLPSDNGPSTLRFPGMQGPESTLCPPPLEVAPDPAPAAGRIGPYRLLRVLGEGGMGTVYLAEQTEPITRQVALKLIRSGTFDRHRQRRFEAERQALARMSHPFIAQVYEAGTAPDGQPYIAMEYVPGLPITNYCERHRLSLAARLDLFIAICDGVQHAHQKAVLHRDLKPTNILVTESEGGAIPKIIDFGLAKALDEPLAGAALLTADHIVVGTVAYLSPEAAKGSDRDTRSDVYALGVVLYELLTGKRPFEGDASLEILHRIVEGKVARPSSFFMDLAAESRSAVAAARGLEPGALRRALRGDLDAIVLKAMALEPDQRYATAAELSADVRRYLENQPVLAGPPSAGYRTRKFVRRHRTAVAAALLIGLALAGGFVARSLEAARANREAARANQEAEAALQVSNFLASLFDTSDPGKPEARRDLTAGEILDRGARRIRSELAGQPLIKARLLETIGNVDRSLGRYQEAEPLLAEALAIRRARLGEESGEVADSLLSLAMLYRMTSRYREAIPLVQRALSIRQKLGPALEIAKCDMELAGNYARLGDHALAEKLYLATIAIREKELGPEDSDLAATLNNLANLYYSEQRYAEAEKVHLRSIAIKEKMLGPEHYFLAQSLNNLANVYTAQKRFAESETLHRRALAVKLKALGPKHYEVGVSEANLGDVAFQQGHFDEAELHLRRATAIYEAAALPADHDIRAFPFYSLANVERGRGRFAAAEANYQRALEIWSKSLPLDNPILQEVGKEYAALLRQNGRAADAVAFEKKNGIR
jgi:eukaryotic-like serine/threonine-protein kinase